MAIARRTLLFALVAVVAAVLGAFSARWSESTSGPEKALLLDQPRILPAIRLVDHHGRPFDNARLTGAWSFVFFGFTNCPDVCPAALFTLDQALERIGPAGDGTAPRVVMISVDPARDTPQKLAAYVPYFDPDFLGVTGDMPEIKRLTDAIGVAFAYTPTPGSGDGYTVDHTASIFLLDPDGRLSAIFSTPHDAGTIASDFRRIAGGRS